MTYDIIFMKQGRISFFHDSLLDGLFDKELLLHTRTDFVEKLGLCDKCYGRMAHIICNDIDPGGYTNKYCPVLFHDLIKPTWKLEWVAGFYLNKQLSKDLYNKRPLSERGRVNTREGESG